MSSRAPWLRAASPEVGWARTMDALNPQSGLKAERAPQTDPAQTSGKENIVIETHKPQTFWEYVKYKLSALTGGEVTLNLAAQKLADFQALGLSEKLVDIVIGASIIFGLVAFISWLISWWRAEHNEKRLTDKMVTENSTPANFVHFASTDKLDEWKRWGL